MRIGVIGVGNIGTAHAGAIYNGEVKGMHLSALCDISEKRAKELEIEFSGVPVFTNSDEMIESGLVDGVIIATPHYFHPIIAASALKSSLHVLCEKPLGVYTKGLDSLVSLANEKKLVFSVMLNQRANKLFGLAKEIVESGKIGEIKHSVWIINNWYRTEEYYKSGDWRATWSGEGGGVLLNQAVHNLDLYQWILGMPCALTAQLRYGTAHDIEVEDEAAIYTEYENGARGVFLTSTSDYLGTNRLEISATGGRIIIEKGILTLETLSADERLYSKGESDPPYTKTEQFFDEEYNGHRKILENFASAVLNGEMLISPARDGLCQLSLVNAAYLSSWKNERVELPISEDEYLKYLEEKIRTSVSHKKGEHKDLYSASYKKRWNTNW